MEKLFNISCFSPLLKRPYLLVVFAGICYCLSCKKSDYADEHSDFVHAVIKKIDEANVQYHRTSQPAYIDEAVHFIDSAFTALPAPGAGDIYIRDSILEHKFRYIDHDCIKAIVYLDSMMAVVRNKTDEEKYAERYAIILYNKGEAFKMIKRYNEALYYTSRAEEAVLKFVKNKCNLSGYSGWKANLLFAQEKYLSSALYYIQQSRYLQSHCNTGNIVISSSMGACLNNIALSYLRAGMPDSASWYENAALKTFDQIETLYPSHRDLQYEKAVVYADQAEVLAIQEKNDQAAALYQKSIAGTSKLDTFYTQQTLARLAGLYLKENNREAALGVLKQLEISLNIFNNEKPAMEWHQLMAKYYASAKQPDTAFIYQKSYERIRDFVEARDKKFMTADIGKAFENLELEYSNDVLQKESKLTTIYLYFAIAIFLTISAIAIFIWYNLRQTRKLHRQMKEKNDKMQIALASLEQSHQENNRIIRIVAHDLKTPVSTINNLAFLLLRKNLSEDLRETFTLIKKACSNSMGLINDVLLQKKRPAVIMKELVDMKTLLEYCVNLLQTKAAEKNQHLHLQAEVVSVMLNRQKMWRVISNIVNNAIKFSPEHAAIEINLQRRKTSILLSVHDKGIGIPENLKDKIFTLSPEASRQGTFGEQSYGLGLSISQKIIEEHQGKIWFDSVDGKGSVFYIELPSVN